MKRRIVAGTILGLAVAVVLSAQTSGIKIGNLCIVMAGTAAPESSVTAGICSLYLRSGTAGLFTKESGSSNTGWGQVVTVANTVTLTNKTLDAVRLSAGTLNIAAVSLTNAQVKALPTTPFILVASPGVNKRVVLLHADVVASFAAAAYTNINAAAYANITQGGNLASSYLANDAGPTPALTHFSDVFGAAAIQLVTFLPWQDTSEAASQWGLLASVANVTSAQNLVLEINNSGSGDLTGGNAANTMTVTVTYYIRP